MVASDIRLSCTSMRRCCATARPANARSKMARALPRKRYADCSGVIILENENGEPLDVGRQTRSIPPPLRRALHARHRGCRFPGCTHTHYVGAHHVKHWAHGGETKP